MKSKSMVGCHFSEKKLSVLIRQSLIGSGIVLAMSVGSISQAETTTNPKEIAELKGQVEQLLGRIDQLESKQQETTILVEQARLDEPSKPGRLQNPWNQHRT